MAQTVASRFGTAFSAWLQRLGDWAIIRDEPDLDQSSTESNTAVVPGLSLSARFAFVATIVLCNGMALLGGWVVTEIERGLLQASAVEESAFVQSIFEPVILALVNDPATPAQTAIIDDLISKSALLDKRFASVAVWRPDGSVAYSTDKELIGRSFPLTADIQSAISGELRTNLWEKRLLGVYPKRTSEIPERMIYAPLRGTSSGKVVAVAEIADNAALPKAQLDAIRKRTWMVVGSSTALMILLLCGIVHSGSRTIDEQRLELERRFNEQARLAQTNQNLCERLQASNRHGIELGEQLLRRIGMDLQNGPAQLLALALLRMDELKSHEDKVDAPGANSTASPGSVVELVERATSDALKEIRTIEAGLILPELRKLSPSQALEKVIRAHEHVTGNRVEQNISGLPQQLPLPVTICIFRFAQAALSVGYGHPAGCRQKVDGFGDSASVTVVITSDALYLPLEQPTGPMQELELTGLRQRVESIGGTFEIKSTDGKAAQFRMWLPFPIFELKECNLRK